MKRPLLIMMVAALFAQGCNTSSNEKTMNDNPFFVEYGTPYETPAFHKIKNEHYLPAFKEGIRMEEEEIAAIVANEADPDFGNTIAAIDRSGILLMKVSNVFYNLTSALTSDTLQQIARDVAPMLSAHSDNISLNEELFARVKAVYEQKDQLDLTTEQEKLLDKTYKRFVRGGANLEEGSKARMREINKELSLLSLEFDDNLLAETNEFMLVIEDEKDLAGLPDFVVTMGAETAAGEGMEGKWVYTLHKPSLIPFLTYAGNRELREKIFKGYINRGNNDNEYDNKEIASKMAALRVERAGMLDYETHAHYILAENMAKNPENVYQLMGQVWEAALPVARQEALELQKKIASEGGDFKLQPWDWWYYAEKVRKEKYDLSEEELKPYFELTRVREGMFEVADKLYGLTFEVREDIPVYHPEVTAYEVKDHDGSHVGILYQDFFPRASKQGGAWMNSYRKQFMMDGENVSPVITMVMNFTKPTAEEPSLLTFDEVSTMFHEFGHALHGLLSECEYRTLSGTSVPRDFVELPSQIMENWASDPEVLKMYAVHYKTGEPLPEELIQKMKNSRHFNQGFATVEFTAAAFLDMDWHTLTTTERQNTLEFENKSMEKIGMPEEIVVRYRSPYFAHIFAGGYSSGYYSYQWAEVLDADAFEAFKENGLFDQATAKAFRENILQKGGTDDPMKLYVNFRGKEPSTEPMLKRKGLL